MAFMEPEYIKDDFIEIETDSGTWFVPESCSGIPREWMFVSNRYRIVNLGDDGFKNIAAFYGDYVGGGPKSIITVSYIANQVGCRLSAPGYLDCTEWSVFDTIQEARAFIENTYDVDPDTGEDLEEAT